MMGELLEEELDLVLKHVVVLGTCGGCKTSVFDTDEHFQQGMHLFHANPKCGAIAAATRPKRR